MTAPARARTKVRELKNILYNGAGLNFYTTSVRYWWMEGIRGNTIKIQQDELVRLIRERRLIEMAGDI